MMFFFPLSHLLAQARKKEETQSSSERLSAHTDKVRKCRRLRFRSAFRLHIGNKYIDIWETSTMVFELLDTMGAYKIGKTTCFLPLRPSPILHYTSVLGLLLFPPRTEHPSCFAHYDLGTSPRANMACRSSRGKLDRWAPTRRSTRANGRHHWSVG